MTPVHLSRAAAILLVAAGVAVAMPGSPIRQWIEPGAPSPTTVETTPQVEDQDRAAGIDVPVIDGGIRIALTGVSDGARVEVRWIDEATARISGRPGSAYSFAAGRAEAAVAPGLVRVALPRDASTIKLDINGRTMMERTGSRLDVSEEAVDQSPDRIVFEIHAR